MEMPFELRSAIEKETEGIQIKALALSASTISERYRSDRTRIARMVQSKQEAIAYAAARMPATYGAASSVLGQLTSVLQGKVEISTIIDVGAGTGTASWAASEFLSPENIICLERDSNMLEIGRNLMWSSNNPVLNQSQWIKFDLSKEKILQTADLVIASYMLNEIDENLRIQATLKLWNAANKYLVIIEPGTPEGYRQLMLERSCLLEHGAHLMAPCAHEGACTLPSGDWCHFSCRISRSRMQKVLKDGQAPYEDEKFSYMIFSRVPCVRGNRILRHPLNEPSKITLTLCTENECKIKIIRRKDVEFRQARKAKWGDSWNPTKNEE